MDRLQALALVAAALMPLRAEATEVVAVRHQAGRTYITFPDKHDRLGPEVTLDRLAQRKRRTRGVRYVVRLEGAAPDAPPLAEVGAYSSFARGLHGKKPKPGAKVPRLAVVDDTPLLPGTGLVVLAPTAAGARCFVIEERTKKDTEVLGRGCVEEAVGHGAYIRQSQTGPTRFHQADDVVVERFVRFEAPPFSNRMRVGHYLVAVPPTAPAGDRAAGLFLHAWGGDASRGYGVWHGAARGAVLLSFNQDPYDWYTAYHEAYGETSTLGSGKAEPFTLRRALAFVDWATARYHLDRRRLFVAGSSMGGTGASMFATSAPERFAWARSDVGVHVPRRNPAFAGAFRRVWGKPGAAVTTPEGLSPWERYDNAHRVREQPSLRLPLIVFANGVNDDNVAFAQAVEMVQALQHARQPHVFTWGTKGHGQRATFMGGARRWPPVDVTTTGSLPALTRCSLDTPLSNKRGWVPRGQINGWVLWGAVVDTSEQWATALWLHDQAPRNAATVDVTPRRTTGFRPEPGGRVTFVVLEGEREIQRGEVGVDANGLVTAPGVGVSTARRTVVFRRAADGG